MIKTIHLFELKSKQIVHVDEKEKKKKNKPSFLKIKTNRQTNKQEILQYVYKQKFVSIQ